MKALQFFILLGVFLVVYFVFLVLFQHGVSGFSEGFSDQLNEIAGFLSGGGSK